jgi:UDP-N-acetylglucosamine 2-epimerase (non-hydrolysing)
MKKIDASKILRLFNLNTSGYLLCTLHRPGNVDNKESLEKIINVLNEYAQNHKIIFPVHPRTRIKMIDFGIGKNLSANLTLCDPIGYIDFLCLVKNAALIITDSGGIQEESTFLNVPCITLRENTERPVTIDIGTNYLAGTDITKMNGLVSEILNGKTKKGTIPPLWDGKAAERICGVLASADLDSIMY